MDSKFIEENHIPERYLLGQLSQEESADFEEYYLDHPEMVDRLELVQAWRDGLGTLAFEELAQTTGRLGLLAWLARLGRGGQTLIIGGFCLLLLAVPALLFSWRIEDFQRRLDALGSMAPMPAINATVLDLSPVRDGGGEAPVRLNLADQPGWLVFSLALDLVDRDRYAVILTDVAGHEIWRGGGLKPDYRDCLVAMIHSAMLAPGDYELVVMGASNDQPLAKYRFQTYASQRSGDN